MAQEDLREIILMPAVEEALKRGVRQETIHRYLEIEFIQAGNADITLGWLCALLDGFRYLPAGPNTLFSIS